MTGPTAGPAAGSTRGVVGVVGAGIVGLAVAREIGLRRPDLRVVVLEKEDRVAVHQTGHNSGVVHAGVYYPPDSLKARLCRDGVARLREYCTERDLPYEECGKLVVAVSDDEVPRLRALQRNAGVNGVPGLRWLGPDGLREIEPYADGVAALHSPSTAITDFTRVAESLAADVAAAGGEVVLGFDVDRISRQGGRIAVHQVAQPRESGHRGRAAHHGKGADVAGSPVLVDRLVLCPGLHADVVAGMARGAKDPRIVPFRGEYLALRPDRRHLVNGLIYPVPDPRYPFLGVHFTRRVSGQVEIGPNAVLALAREGYGRAAVDLAGLRALATWPGAWRLARAHWRTGVRELAGSASTRMYLRAAGRYVPEVGIADVARGATGVRAQAVDRSGALVDDFRITHAEGITAVRNAPSPAATSALAIAGYVVDDMLTAG